MLERHGIAHIIHKKNLLKPEKLKKAILKVLNDPGYERSFLQILKDFLQISRKRYPAG